MSNRLGDIINKLQELEKINPDATIIIPGFDFYDHNVKTMRVKRNIDDKGRQYHSSCAYSKDDFNVVVLAADQTRMPERSIYKTMNKELPEQMVFTLTEFIRSISHIDEVEEVEELVSEFLEENYTTGTIYFLDRQNWFTCERELLDIFPRLRQMRNWQTFLFKTQGAWNGFKKSIMTYSHMLDMFGDEESIEKMKSVRIEPPPSGSSASLINNLRENFPQFVHNVKSEKEKEKPIVRKPRVTVVRNTKHVQIK